MGTARIEFHYDGFNELRRSYQDEIDAIGERAAASACAMTSQVNDDERGGSKKASEEPFTYEAKPNATRARGLVKTSSFAGKRAQARGDVLTRSLFGG